MAGVEEIFVSAVLDIWRQLKYSCVMRYNGREGIWDEMMVCCTISWSSAGGTEEERQKPNSEYSVCILKSSVGPCEFHSVMLLLGDML